LSPNAYLTLITGWFDPAPKGGFLRLAANSYLPAKGDAPVRLPGLRRGDLLTLQHGRVLRVNGAPPGALLGAGPEVAQLGAVHPSRPLSLETPHASGPRTAEIQRVVDLVCPFGFGQRALIVSPPKAGKTVMLQAVAEGVALNYPEAILLILLVDERPEEVSEMIDWGRGEVIASSFDLPYERHVAVADMVFDGARRRIYPAVDIAASGTRREELLANPATVEAKQKLRRGLVGLPPEKAMDVLLAQIRRAKTNAELLAAS